VRGHTDLEASREARFIFRDRPHGRQCSAPKLRYNDRVLKRVCTRRAEWRLLRGKPAQHLSPHYRLDCDYGTSLIASYKEGEGDDPIYLCESHAAAIGRSDSNCDGVAGVGSIGAQSTDSNNLTKNGGGSEILQSATAKPRASSPSQDLRRAPTEKVGREKADARFGGPTRDLTFGNSAKALVDETIWNMATGDLEAYRAALREGKTATEAAQAAGGQLAIVYRKISQYTLKIEALLSESKKTINVGDVIDNPLERAVLEIIRNKKITDAEKDAVVDHLGALQEWIKRGNSREMTPLQAHRIACAIGDRVNWGATSSLSEELKPAYRAVYGSLRNAIRAAVPRAHDLAEHLVNLYAARSDLENMPTMKIALPPNVSIVAARGSLAREAESPEVQKATLA